MNVPDAWRAQRDDRGRDRDALAHPGVEPVQAPDLALGDGLLALPEGEEGLEVGRAEDRHLVAGRHDERPAAHRGEGPVEGLAGRADRGVGDGRAEGADAGAGERAVQPEQVVLDLVAEGDDRGCQVLVHELDRALGPGHVLDVEVDGLVLGQRDRDGRAAGGRLDADRRVGGLVLRREGARVRDVEGLADPAGLEVEVPAHELREDHVAAEDGQRPAGPRLRDEARGVGQGAGDVRHVLVSSRWGVRLFRPSPGSRDGGGAGALPASFSLGFGPRASRA